MLERRVEEAMVQAARLVGGWALKWVSPGQDGVPDRIVLQPVPDHHRDIVAQYVSFVELKAPGEQPTPIQMAVHKRLRALGFQVDVVDTVEAAHAYFS